MGAYPDRHDRGKWHTGKGPISVTGAKFMNWSEGRGGGGAIDLVLHLQGCDFKAAVAWLADHFPCPPFPGGPERRPGLNLPREIPELWGRVEDYLLRVRRLPVPVLRELKAMGTLYADERRNAVFLMRAESGDPVGAELRGTGPVRWRGMAPGSRKNLGFFSIGPLLAEKAILCESAIDAISCLAIHPGTLCISTSGAASNPEWLSRLQMPHRKIYCGFDADETGDHVASLLCANYPGMERIRPSHHDWNDQLCSMFQDRKY
jgi:hypothetical protein